MFALSDPVITKGVQGVTFEVFDGGAGNYTVSPAVGQEEKNIGLMGKTQYQAVTAEILEEIADKLRASNIEAKSAKSGANDVPILVVDYPQKDGKEPDRFLKEQITKAFDEVALKPTPSLAAALRANNTETYRG